MARTFLTITTLAFTTSILTFLQGCAISNVTSIEEEALTSQHDDTIGAASLSAKQDAWHKNVINLAITSHLGDNQTYIEGDTIYYFISTDQGCYLLLIYQDAEGNLVQIIPNRYLGKSYVQAGDFIMVPKTGEPFSFSVSAPFGEESIYAFASSKPFPELQGKPLPNGFRLLENNSISELKNELRDLNKPRHVFYGEAQTSITTIPRAEIM
jgi:hypothetical protein